MEFPTYNQRIADAVQAATKMSPYPSLLGIEIVEFRPGAVTCRLPVDDKLMSGVGAMHGGAITSLIDHALSVCVYPLVEVGKWVATLEYKVNYLAPVKKDTAGGYIEAEAQVVSLKKLVAIVRIDVKTKNGDHVATAQGTGYIREKLSS
jgi:uncharacterized protein (TIGR00369 family)